MTGIIMQYLLFGVSFSRPERQPLLPSLFDEPISEPFIDACGTNKTVKSAYLRPGLGNAVFAEEDAWTQERISEMIHSTKGFLARDWPLYLGWNNVSTPPFPGRLFSIRSGSFVAFPVTASVHPGRRNAGSQANQQNAHTALLRLCPSVYC